ncbi:MAG: chalcone isomerase family protein [Rhizobacter sp.]|nr:chalcone isomerase family protein [Rhizobacter sp.]
MSTLSRRSTLAALACLPFSTFAQTSPQPSELSALPGARLRGQGRLTFLGLNVYSAKLWVTDSFKPDDFISHPVALELEYARSLVGSLIAERSLTEMKRVGEVPAEKAEPWLAAMTQLFPDVNKGDRITGLHQPGEGMRFFFNGKPRGDVRDAAFARLFTGIWLSPRTSEPKLRQALLGSA